MKRVVVESPWAGNVPLHLRYLRACMRDCLKRGEAPFASHSMYTQEGVLEDTVPAERALGMAAGFAWREVADLTAVYCDFGVSPGMQAGIDHANALGRTIETRWLGGEWGR